MDSFAQAQPEASQATLALPGGPARRPQPAAPARPAAAKPGVVPIERKRGQTSRLDIENLAPVSTVDPDEDFVRNLYREILGREPDLDGMAHHLAKLKQGLTHAQLRQGFLDSHELRLRNAQPNDLFVRNLYRELLDREPEAREMAHQMDLLAEGLSRFALIQTVLASPEYMPSATHAAKLPPILPPAIRAPRVSTPSNRLPDDEPPRPLNGPLLAIPLMPRSSVEWEGGEEALSVRLPARLGASIDRAVLVDGDGRALEQAVLAASPEANRTTARFARAREAYPARANVVVELKTGQRARFALPEVAGS